jgi:hypothetical protein
VSARLCNLSIMSVPKFEQFVRQCLLRRTHSSEFRELAGFMNEKYQMPGRAIIQSIVECRQSFSVSSDPLIPQYIRAAVESGLSQTSDVLYVLIGNWNSALPQKGLSAEVKTPGCLSSPDSIIINDLAVITASNQPPCNSSEIRKSLSFASRWLIALIGWISEDGEKRSYLAILTLLEALGILFASSASTEQGMLLIGNQEDMGKLDTTQKSVPTLAKLTFTILGLKVLLAEALETVLPLLTSISVPLHNRLDLIQKHFHLFRTDRAKDTDHLMQNSQSISDALQFEANIVDDSNVHARASLYMYFNAAVSASLLSYNLIPTH